MPRSWIYLGHDVIMVHCSLALLARRGSALLATHACHCLKLEFQHDTNHRFASFQPDFLHTPGHHNRAS